VDYRQCRSVDTEESGEGESPPHSHLSCTYPYASSVAPHGAEGVEYSNTSVVSTGSSCSDNGYSSYATARFTAFVPIVPLTETYSRPQATPSASSISASPDASPVKQGVHANVDGFAADGLGASGVLGGSPVGPGGGPGGVWEEEVTCGAVGSRVLELLRRELRVQLEASTRMHQDGPPMDFQEYHGRGHSSLHSTSCHSSSEGLIHMASDCTSPVDVLSMACCCADASGTGDQQHICNQHLHVSLAPDTQDVLVQGLRGVSSLLVNVHITKGKTIAVSVPGHMVMVRFAADKDYCHTVQSACVSLNISSLAVALLQAVAGIHSWACS
jgi:hypothetical protein